MQPASVARLPIVRSEGSGELYEKEAAPTAGNPSTHAPVGVEAPPTTEPALAEAQPVGDAGGVACVDDTGADGPAPEAAFDDGFSGIVARWMDDGDRMNDAPPALEERLPAAAPGRWEIARARVLASVLEFLARFRSERFRYRALIAGAGALSLILVLALRHQSGSAAPATLAPANAPSAAPVATAAPPAAEPAPEAPPVRPHKPHAQHPGHKVTSRTITRTTSTVTSRTTTRSSKKSTTRTSSTARR